MGKARLPGWRATPREVKLAVDLYHQGYGIAAISIRLGRHADWVRTQVIIAANSSGHLPAPTNVDFAPASL